MFFILNESGGKADYVNILKKEMCIESMTW
jgi:hypothetical protein